MVRYKFKSRNALLESSIAATEAAKTFGRLVSRVSETRATYVIERGGTPVARIGPVDIKDSTVGALMNALRSPAPAFDDEYVARVKRGVRDANKPEVPKNPWAR